MKYLTLKNRNMQITVSKQMAEDLNKAINFMIIGCTNSPDHKEIDTEGMKILEITPEGLIGLINIKNRLIKMIDREERTLRGPLMTNDQ
jgi:hypothetical protein